MKKLKVQNRVERIASHTALIGAFHRFLATKDKRIEGVGPDKLAYIFLPLKARFFLSFSLIRNLIYKRINKQVPGSYEYITARTNFFDEIFIKATQERTPQIVLLGAGFDTRAIRFHLLTKDSIIYELDALTTQNEKKRLLKNHRISLPENIAFVSVNFNKDDLKTVLLSHGYNPEKKTVFLWEGVTMYIKPESVKRTLLFIKNNSGIGTTVAFDYFYQSVIDGTSTSLGAKSLSDSVGKLGEKFNFGIEESRIEEFLKENGFLLVKHYGPKELEERYLRMNDGNIIGNIYGFAGHVIAKVRKEN